MHIPHKYAGIFVAVAVWAGLLTLPAAAQLSTDTPVSLTLEDAVELALQHNYSVRAADLALQSANAQIMGALGQRLPLVTLSSSYQRNLKTANPFAGSSAGSFFEGLGSIGWLAYNEEARTDDDPSTTPISMDEFFRRQQEGLDEAGIVVSQSDNPFAVDNTFFNGVSVTQKLFDWRVFVGVNAAKTAREVAEKSLERQMQLTVHQVRAAYFQALLAQENASVVAASINRTAETLGDTRKRVAQGVVSKYQRLSAEVELSNLETQLIQAENAAELALNNLKLIMGLSVDAPVQLAGALEDFFIDQVMVQPVALNDAVSDAISNRPDLQRAELNVELQELLRRAEYSAYMPNVSAFANFNYSGRVPDNRTGFRSDPDDPFSFTQTDRSFFSSAYWNPDVNVGITLSWTIFDGFGRRANVQQQKVNLRQRELEYEQLYQTIRNEVDATLKNVRAATRRIESQQQNIQRAELNYTFASTRLEEGVSSSLEERQASDLLDQSRVGYLQAVHDYLVALSNYYTTIGTPMVMHDATMQVTSR